MKAPKPIMAIPEEINYNRYNLFVHNINIEEKEPRIMEYLDFSKKELKQFLKSFTKNYKRIDTDSFNTHLYFFN